MFVLLHSVRRLAPAVVTSTLLVVLVLVSACASQPGAPASQPPASKAAASQAPASQAPASQAPASAAAKPTVPPQPPDKVKFGYGSRSVTYYWAQLAKDEGIFQKNNLDVELTFMQSGVVALQALIAGEIAFALSGSSEVAAANVAGADIKIIASTSPYMNFMVAATDKVNTAQDLKGKKIGISRFGASSDTAVKTFLKKVGLEYQKDVAIVAVGDDRTRLAAMAGGAIDATVITSPGLQAKPFGFKILADLADYKILSESGPLDTTGKLIKEKPDVVRRMIKSVIDAVHLANKDRAAAAKAMKTFYQTDDQETVEANIDWAIKHFQKVPYVSEEGVQFAIDELAESSAQMKGVKAAPHIDNSFVAEFEKSGYVKQLYGN